MKKTLLFLSASVLLLGVFAFAEDNNESESTGDVATVTATTTATDNTAAIACAKTALEKREAAIKSAMDIYYASRGTAFAARTTAFTDALFLATKKEVKKAIDTGWKTYKKAIQDARKTKKGTVQTTWSTFRTEVKACKGDLVKVLKEENGKSDLND